MRLSKTAWYDNTPLRVRFEQGVRDFCPSLVAPRAGRGGGEVVYRAKLDVPYYDTTRSVEVEFARGREILTPRLTADGPTESPHRYSGGSLCVWEPTDPPEERWIPRDGLAELLRMATVHLFKEAWWRENGEWLGPEILHASGAKE